MNIGIDIMGGDYAPEQPIKGIASFISRYAAHESVTFTLIGCPDAAAPYLNELDAYKSSYQLLPSQSVIGMHEHPTKALKEKPDSSIAIGFGMLQAKKIDAFISAGNTGAMMVGAMYTVKAVEGVHRPTIASPIPKTGGNYNFLLDVGANADCKPEHLVQFAQMGTTYAKLVLGLENPKVGLLNLGEEEGKGNLLAQATYPLLKENASINFIGNMEGRDIFVDKADVIVCEGFTGNVILKAAESIYNIFKEERKVNDAFLEQFNYEIYGGTPILGVNAPVIIGHGISNALAFENMIMTAVKQVKSGYIEAIQKQFNP